MLFCPRWCSWSKLISCISVLLQPNLIFEVHNENVPFVKLNINGRLSKSRRSLHAITGGTLSSSIWRWTCKYTRRYCLSPLHVSTPAAFGQISCEAHNHCSAAGRSITSWGPHLWKGEGGLTTLDSLFTLLRFTLHTMPNATGEMRRWEQPAAESHWKRSEI